ncbi:MAG TPA: hypothetical protein VNM92_16260 [Thermoanaerobaculia bacterium]|nr:hypothetical protein [Thermoanaerobaculia bacterium]
MATDEYYDAEYKQAHEALEAIMKQGNTLLFMGSQADLAKFINQFIDMASNKIKEAEFDDRADVVTRFLDLIQKAEDLRQTFKLEAPGNEH